MVLESKVGMTLKVSGLISLSQLRFRYSCRPWWWWCDGDDDNDDDDVMVMMTIYDDDDDEVSAYLLVRDDRVAQGAIGHPPERKNPPVDKKKSNWIQPS